MIRVLSFPERLGTSPSEGASRGVTTGGSGCGLWACTTGRGGLPATGRRGVAAGFNTFRTGIYCN